MREMLTSAMPMPTPNGEGPPWLKRSAHVRADVHGREGLFKE